MPHMQREGGEQDRDRAFQPSPSDEHAFAALETERHQERQHNGGSRDEGEPDGEYLGNVFGEGPLLGIATEASFTRSPL
jgi:hypothetical protein